MRFVAIAVLILGILQGYFAARLGHEDCTLIENPIFEPDYTPLGIEVIAGGLEAYETGDPDLTTMLIGVHDIYGLKPSTYNIWQICDTLAAQGYRVVLPDFFHGERWKREHYPYPTE